MKYMMIVKATKNSEAGVPPDASLIEAISKQAAEMQKAGVLLASGGLLPSSQGTRIKVAGSKLYVIDGPFAETKELVGGFAIMEANSKEHAVQLGREFMQLHADVLGPSYEGELEIRPMWEPEAACAGNHV